MQTEKRSDKEELTISSVILDRELKYLMNKYTTNAAIIHRIVWLPYALSFFGVFWIGKGGGWKTETGAV